MQARRAVSLQPAGMHVSMMYSSPPIKLFNQAQLLHPAPSNGSWMVRSGRVHCRAITLAIPFQVTQWVPLQVRIPTTLSERAKILASMVVVRVDYFPHAPLAIAPDAHFLGSVRERKSFPTGQVDVRVLCARPFRVDRMLVTRRISVDGAKYQQHSRDQRVRPHRDVPSWIVTGR